MNPESYKQCWAEADPTECFSCDRSGIATLQDQYLKLESVSLFHPATALKTQNVRGHLKFGSKFSSSRFFLRRAAILVLIPPVASILRAACEPRNVQWRRAIARQLSAAAGVPSHIVEGSSHRPGPVLLDRC